MNLLKVRYYAALNGTWRERPPGAGRHGAELPSSTNAGAEDEAVGPEARGHSMDDRQLRLLLDLGSLVLLAMLVGSFAYVINTAMHAAAH